MQHLQALQNKITTKEELLKIMSAKRIYGHKIVFTNGCFDILHPGHIRYLSAARDMGDFLAIGLNSDDSVSRLKGSTRPIQKQDVRAELMAALHIVDAIVIFDEDTPLELISFLKPDVLVKGGDYTINTIVGADIVQHNGGRVEVIPFEDGYSTTNLLETIKANG